MSKFQRIKDVLFSAVILLFAVAILMVPQDGFEAVALVIGFLLLIYGGRKMWYYFRMARHMVGGKSILYQSIIVLDLALFTLTVASMSSFVILFYLLGVYAFTGVISILRAFEAKRFGAAWKFKLISGIVSVLFALFALILGVAFDNKEILVYGFSISLFYEAAVRIVNAFRKTAVVYVQ